jgi:hypothetical protein
MTNPPNSVSDEVLIKSLQPVKQEYLEKIVGTRSRVLNLGRIEALFYDQPTFLKKVLVLHFIIMYYDKAQVRYYLENLYQENSLLTVNLIINYPVQFNFMSTINHYNNGTLTNLFMSNTLYPRFDYYNMFNSLHVASLWTNDVELIRMLYSWGACVWSRDQHGYYSDELSQRTLYFDHLLEYYSTRENITGLYYAKRSYNEFLLVNNEINLLAGESIPRDHGLQDWSLPIIY